MSAVPLSAVLSALVVTAAWLATYRLPLADPGRANRFALALSTVTSLRPDRAFASFATLLYTGLGALACLVLASLTGVSVLDLFTVRLGTQALAATVAAIVGAMTAVALGMSVLYAVHPGVDVPGAIRRVRWIASAASLPSSIRVAVPVAGAVAEETFFRGVCHAAVVAGGADPWVAFAVATVLFTVGQIAITDNLVAAGVIGWSSLVISVFGTLLVVTYGSVLPALLVHASFAGFYTGTSWEQA